MSHVDKCTCDSLCNSKGLWADANCFIVMTGASRGYGRALCVELVKAISTGPDCAASLTLFLMSQNFDGMKVTESEILKYKSNDSPMELDIITTPIAVDMSKADEKMFRQALDPFFAKHKFMSDSSPRPQWNMLVHNAATLGSIEQHADQRYDINSLNTYYQLNLTTMIVLTGVFLNHFAPLTNTIHEPVTIVNISSIAASKPLTRMTDYCVGKAARQMYLKCLSVDRPSIAVFNFSPGPLDTEMFKTIIEKHGDPSHRSVCLKMKESGNIIQPKQSASVCVEWLRRQNKAPSDESQQTKRPYLMFCPVHLSQWKYLWEGCPLDYFDAVTSCKI